MRAVGRNRALPAGPQAVSAAGRCSPTAGSGSIAAPDGTRSPVLGRGLNGVRNPALARDYVSRATVRLDVVDLLYRAESCGRTSCASPRKSWSWSSRACCGTGGSTRRGFMMCPARCWPRKTGFPWPCATRPINSPRFPATCVAIANWCAEDLVPSELRTTRCQAGARGRPLRRGRSIAGRQRRRNREQLISSTPLRRRRRRRQ